MTKNNEIENCMNNSNAAITSTDETGNTTYVPSYRTSTGSKLNSLATYFLPEDCKVETRSDFYYVTAIAFLCATFVFPPFIVGVITCVIKAKRQKGGRS